MAEFAAAAGRFEYSSPIPSQQNPYPDYQLKTVEPISRYGIDLTSQIRKTIPLVKPQGQPTNTKRKQKEEKVVGFLHLGARQRNFKTLTGQRILHLHKPYRGSSDQNEDGRLRQKEHEFHFSVWLKPYKEEQELSP
ncbi:hypothetical protein DPMN_060606 [Dreissena polymorpha]|uniref:Uncharacterized protein n=1 Tax=Dreissena polymorpha TaxID=45954 RepID=A0A9D4C678_DREPO|nr:hypothetical protein DPMN_060606 [Dreissena polymorpha]